MRATCSGSTKKGEAHRVDLVARLDGARTSYGTAVLEVVKAKGPGNNVAVQSWTIGGDATGDDDPASTTSTTVPSSTTTTTTTTTVPASDVTTVLKVTAQWESGYCANVDVTNNGRSTTKWTVTVPVQGKIYNFWNGEYTRVRRRADRLRRRLEPVAQERRVHELRLLQQPLTHHRRGHDFHARDARAIMCPRCQGDPWV